MNETAQLVKQELLKKPEERQLKFLELWQEKGLTQESVRECAAKAGYTGTIYPRDAKQIVRRIGNNLEIQKALKKQGITLKRLAKKLDQLLDAEHPQYVGKPDNFTQHKSLETAIRLFDANPSTKIDIDQTNRTEIIISAELVSRIEKYNQLDRKEVIVDGELLP